METDSFTRSTIVLAASPRAAVAVAGDRSSAPIAGSGRDFPPDLSDDGRVDETVARLIRQMIDACGQGDLSRFEAPDLGPADLQDDPAAGEMSRFASSGFAVRGMEDGPDPAGTSCFEAPGFSATSAPDGPASVCGAVPAEERIAHLVREMVNLFPLAGIDGVEDIQVRYPRLPEPALRLIAREAGRNRVSGEGGSAVEVGHPASAGESHSTAPPSVDTVLPHSPRGPMPCPAVGETIGDYRLLVALGRGVRGAVFLADQPSLANRPVVLKVTSRDGREHLSLAQLRHPHIVPLYCVQDLPDRNLRLLCMPYLGGTPLARVVGEMEAVPISRRTGRDLLVGLDRAQAGAPLAAPDQGPARQFLLRASYSQAVCWIGACLADALQFAHHRNLVHLDLKPSNILLAADGTPMLLDFHLAQPPIRPDDSSPRWLGGTPHYMSPEQRLAMMEIHERKPITVAVDGRSDIYALGLVLYQMLGGAISIGPYPMDRIRFRRPAHVPVGLGDILARCLAFDPRDRYPDAGQLAEDLRRHLSHLPLRGVSNRSLAERFRKWSLRHPDAVARTGRILATASALLLAGWLYATADARQRLRGAESLLAEGRKQMEHRDYPAAALALTQGLALIDGSWLVSLERQPSRSDVLRKDLEAHLARARRNRLAEDIHDLADRVRFLYGTDLAPSEGLRHLEQRLGKAWESRGRILARWAGEQDREPEQRLRTDLLDLGILRADLGVRLAPRGREAEARREALRTLDDAERLFGPSPVLARERQSHAESLGLVEVARAAARARADLAPRTAWEHYALGRSLLAAGDLEAAAREFDRATDLQPQDVWAQFSRGLCAYRRHRFATALSAFEVCVALSPGTAACYFNRGLAHAALGHVEQARRDEDHARRLAPAMTAAPADRGLAYEGKSP